MCNRSRAVVECGCAADWLASAFDDGVLLLNYSNLENAPINKLCKTHRHLPKSLCLRWNRLSSLPEDLAVNYPKLCELYLASNRILEIPESIGDLVNLKNLDVSNNRLVELPRSITKLGNLKELSAAKNFLRYLPSDIGVLTNLTFLNVSWNELDHVPSSIGNCVNLRNFYISVNHLSTLPRSVCKLPNLMHLSVSKNELLYFPIDLGHNHQLKIVDMDSNSCLHHCPSHFLKLEFHYDGCGKTPVIGGIDFHDVTLRARSPDISRTLTIPKFIVNMSRQCAIVSLKELSSRSVSNCIAGKKLSFYELQLPNMIMERLLSPLGHCFCCSQCLFWVAYAALEDAISIERNVQGVHFISYFCSPLCAKLSRE